MLVYSGDKAQFLEDVSTNEIDRKIEEMMALKLKKRVGEREHASWMNSMQYMQNILMDSEIPSDCGVAIEFNIPNTAKRVDFIISGLGERDDRNAIIVELKQWSQVESIPSVEQLLRYNPEAEVINVQTILGRGLVETAHPSYQATSYRTLISDYNVNVQELPIRLNSCAYVFGQAKMDKMIVGIPYFDRWTKKASFLH